MPIPDDIDQNRLAEIALAILSLSAFRDGPGTRVWKGLDWDIMNLLHERGWISDPKSKAKSVMLTEEGLKYAEEFLRVYFEAESR